MFISHQSDAAKNDNRPKPSNCIAYATTIFPSLWWVVVASLGLLGTAESFAKNPLGCENVDCINRSIYVDDNGKPDTFVSSDEFLGAFRKEGWACTGPLEDKYNNYLIICADPAPTIGQVYRVTLNLIPRNNNQFQLDKVELNDQSMQGARALEYARRSKPHILSLANNDKPENRSSLLEYRPPLPNACRYSEAADTPTARASYNFECRDAAVKAAHIEERQRLISDLDTSIFVQDKSDRWRPYASAKAFFASARQRGWRCQVDTPIAILPAVELSCDPPPMNTKTMQDNYPRYHIRGEVTKTRRLAIIEAYSGEKPPFSYYYADEILPVLDAMTRYNADARSTSYAALPAYKKGVRYSTYKDRLQTAGWDVRYYGEHQRDCSHVEPLCSNVWEINICRKIGYDACYAVFYNGKIAIHVELGGQAVVTGKGSDLRVMGVTKCLEADCPEPNLK